MATAAFIPVSEYISTTYRPDCDYVDGQLEERNLGERPHSSIQSILCAIFRENRKAWNVLGFTELRVQVGPRRYRVPDLTVVRRSDPVEPIVRTAPLICIEVLSPEDRIQRMQERINDYVRMGVPHIWLIDPETRDAWSALPDGSHRHVSDQFAVPETPIRIPLSEVFAELDELLTQY